MHVRDAVATRFSCRAFLPTPVPLATVRDILDRAARAPSGGNLQPWRVHALAGAPLEDLKARIRPHAPANPRGEGAEYQIYPEPLREPYYARRRDVGAKLYHAIGIPREDRAARYRQYARNFEFFGAPVGLFFSIDRTMGPPQWSDLGMFVQTVMLLARGEGLHTCGIEAWTHWHKTRSRRSGGADQRLACAAQGRGRLRGVFGVSRLGWAKAPSTAEASCSASRAFAHAVRLCLA